MESHDSEHMERTISELEEERNGEKGEKAM